MGYTKKLFADPKVYNEVEFGRKIHKENVLLKLMQEVPPEEHVVSAGFRFPEDKDNRDIFTKTTGGEIIMIGLFVADKETWPGGLNYLQDMLRDEVYRLMRNELLPRRACFTLLTPIDPWRNGRERYTVLFLDRQSEELTEMLKFRLVIVYPGN